MGAPPRGLGQRPSPPQGTEGKEEGCKGPAGLGLEDGGAREAAPAGAFVPQERGQGGSGYERETFLWGGPLGRSSLDPPPSTRV